VSTGIVVAEIPAERDQPPGTDDDSTTTTATSRQPSATAAAARLPPEGPSLVPGIQEKILPDLSNACCKVKVIFRQTIVSFS